MSPKPTSLLAPQLLHVQRTNNASTSEPISTSNGDCTHDERRGPPSDALVSFSVEGSVKAPDIEDSELRPIAANSSLELSDPKHVPGSAPTPNTSITQNAVDELAESVSSGQDSLKPKAISESSALDSQNNNIPHASQVLANTALQKYSDIPTAPIFLAAKTETTGLDAPETPQIFSLPELFPPSRLSSASASNCSAPDPDISFSPNDVIACSTTTLSCSPLASSPPKIFSSSPVLSSQSSTASKDTELKSLDTSEAIIVGNDVHIDNSTTSPNFLHVSAPTAIEDTVQNSSGSTSFAVNVSASASLSNMPELAELSKDTLSDEKPTGIHRSPAEDENIVSLHNTDESLSRTEYESMHAEGTNLHALEPAVFPTSLPLPPSSPPFPCSPPFISDSSQADESSPQLSQFDACMDDQESHPSNDYRASPHEEGESTHMETLGPTDHSHIVSTTTQSVSFTPITESPSLAAINDPSGIFISTVLSDELTIENIDNNFQSGESPIPGEKNATPAPVQRDDKSTAALTCSTDNPQIAGTASSSDRPAKRQRLDSLKSEPKAIATPSPAPRRGTVAFHRKQENKLKKPFRSPLVPSDAPPSSSPTPRSVVYPPNISSSPPPVQSRSRVTLAKAPASSPARTSVPLPNKVNARVKSQFKSPFCPTSPSGAVTAASPGVRMTPVIQSLERQVQILKRAVKVKQSGEEKILEKLVKKWTAAGREVAWEVWSLVRDQAESGGDWGKGTSSSGWAWDDNAPSSDTGASNWGWEGEGRADDEASVNADIEGGSEPHHEEEVKEPDNLGTMLRHLRIAPETLGWDDNLEDFVDA